MNLRQDLETLREIMDIHSHKPGSFKAVEKILGRFDEANNALVPQGNSYCDEKINSVRVWFKMLCGVTDEGFSREQVRDNLKGDLNKLGLVISQDGRSLRPPGAA